MTDELQVNDNVEPIVEPESKPEANSVKSYDPDTMQLVVNREKKKAYERGRQEALMELQQQQQEQTQVQSLGGIQQANPEDIKKMIAEHMQAEMPKMLQDQANHYQSQKNADAFINKMRLAEDRYPGINEKLNELDYETLGPVISLANDLDNTADVMNELMENPSKMSSVMVLTLGKQYSLARKELAKLSNSIKQNESAAAAVRDVREPMSQLKSSTNANPDSSNLSVMDLRKMLSQPRR